MGLPMEVVSECPLTVGSVLWQSGPRAWTLTVVAKATFALAPDLSPLAASQEPVHEHDRHWEDDPSRSLAVAGDLVPFKRRAEVMVVGHAHAPGRDGATSLVARLAIASIDKGIEVRGDQHFTRDGHLTDPLRFKRMPLLWERAAGGPDSSNPVGVPTGTDARFDAWGRCPLPNLVPIGTVSASPYDPIEPIGYGPIAPRWPGRAARLAGLGAAFDPARWSAAPLPEQLDAAYFDAAPRDQQITMLDGTESLLLEHLHPHHPVLTTRLAPVRAQAVFEWGRGRTLDIGLACDTLVIDADSGLATLAFRGHIALDNPQRAGRIVVSLEAPADPRASVPDWLSRVQDVVSTVAGVSEEDGEGGATLPFLNEEEMPTLPKRPRPSARLRTGTQQGTEIPLGPALPFRAPGPPPGPTGTLLPFRVPSSPALPFRAPPPAEIARSKPQDPEETLTLDGAPSPFAAPGPPAPFAAPRTPPTFGMPAQSAPAAHRSSPGSQPAPPARGPSPSVPVAPSARAPLPSVPVAPSARAPSPSVPVAPPARAPLPSVPAALPGRAPSPPPPPPARLPAPSVPFLAPAPKAPSAPPAVLSSRASGPMLAALAHVPGTHEETVDGDALVEEIEAAAEAATHDDGEEIEPEPESDPRPPASASPAAATPIPGAFTIERCARVAASLACRPAARAEVLRAVGLDEATWARLDEHWSRALAEEGERQKNVLLKQHDAAYVAQIEQERGPISIEEYAHLLVASERHGPEAVLASLGIPADANMRIRRVWIARIARDMDFGARVRSALAAERAR